MRIETLERKIMTAHDLDKALIRWRLKGKSTVFTNGVFDILHRGHVTLLTEAAALGDVLILGLNSDASVRTLGKGDDRPINSEQDRAFVLAGLSSIDAVVIFNDSTPYNLIKQIQPDVLVKGGDYDPAQTNTAARDYIVGSDIQNKAGRTTVSIQLVEGFSTTSVIKKMRNGQS